MYGALKVTGTAKTRKKTKRAKLASYADCTVSVFIGTKEMPQIKTLEGKFNKVHEMSYEAVWSVVKEVADKMAEECDLAHDVDKPGALYYHERTIMGKRKGKSTRQPPNV
eukprot:COSAG06_NODE_716_length_12859_cov_5.127900_1_plen_110_part_00